MRTMNLQERLLRLYRYWGIRHIAYVCLKALTVEIPRSVPGVGGLKLPHGAAGLVIHPTTKLMGSAKMFQGVTVGRADNYLEFSHPASAQAEGVVVEDGVQISAGAKVLFKSGQTLRLGRNCVVGANAVVLRSIPDNEVWAGAPARRVGIRRVPPL